MKWDDEKVWELLEMYEDPEVSVKEIAEHFGVSKTKIYYIANKNEIKRGTWIEQGYKKCPKCGCVLEIKEFHKNKSVKSGVNGYCKECYRKIKGNLKRNNSISEAEKNRIIDMYIAGMTTKEIEEITNICDKRIRSLISRERRKGRNIPYKRGKVNAR